MTTNDNRAADDAIWQAFDERRAKMRAKKGAWGGYKQQQHQGLREKYEQRRLIDDLVEIMKLSAIGSTGTPQQLSAVAQAIKNGFQPWEEILIREDELWTPFFRSPRVQEGAKRAIKDANDWAEWN